MMQLTQLHYFVMVARYEHMSKAALELDISQSSLSKTIARLETDLGVDLFERKGKSIKLNLYGQRFYERVEKILGDLSAAKEEVQDLANAHEDSLTINVMNSKLLPSLFSSFYNKRPNIKIHQITLKDDQALQKLIDGSIDLLIVPNEILDERIAWEPLFDEELFLLVPKNHPLAAKEAISLSEAKGEKFITYEKGQSIRATTDRLFQEAGFLPKVAFEGDELSLILQLVNEGAGISFFPKYSFLDTYLQETKMMKIKSPASFQTVGIAWLKDSNHSFVINSFRDFAIGFLREAGGWKNGEEEELAADLISSPRK